MKILLIGDSCIDIYHYGSVERISPEAPVPIFKLLNQETKPGMAGNVRENFRALGVSTMFVSSEKSTKTRLIDINHLGELLVTCHVPTLGVGEITTALGRGLAYAQGLVDRGLIHAALIACQNRYAACGLESYWEADIQGDLAA